MGKILKAEKIYKAYKDKSVLMGLDLIIEPGKIYGSENDGQTKQDLPEMENIDPGFLTNIHNGHKNRPPGLFPGLADLLPLISKFHIKPPFEL